MLLPYAAGASDQGAEFSIMRVRPARPRRLRLSQHPWRDALVTVVLLLVVVTGGLETRDAGRTAERAAEHEAALGTLEAHFAVSHTWLEEYVSGDPGIDLGRDIYGNQAQAAELCTSLRDGGPAGGTETIDPLEDRAAERRAARVCSGIEAFRRLTDRRISDKRREQIGSPAEQRFDVAFRQVLSDTERLRNRLQQITAAQHDRARVIELVVVLALITLLIAAAVTIRQRERELATLASEREIVLESTAEGILAVDRNGIVQYLNAAAARLLGWPVEELLGQPFRVLLPADAQPRGTRPLPTWIDVDESSRGEDRELCRYDGSTLPIAYSVSPPPARAAAGSFVVSFGDASRRRRHEAQREAELAELRTIKQALVPPPAGEREGIEIATCHVAAVDGVAGDFHLVVDGPNGSTIVVVGDVAGKGIVAARRAAYLRATLATFASYEDDPCRLLQLGNRSLVDTAGVSHMFVTAVCAVLDPGRRRVRWSSAGHPPPIHIPSGVSLAGSPCLPLGLTPELDCSCHEADLEPEAGLLLYTDGLTEARTDDAVNPSLLGIDQVGRLVSQLPDAAPQELADALRALATRHSDGRLADDLCMVAVRVSPEAATSSSGSPYRRGADAG